jgi:hypothetical protein
MKDCIDKNISVFKKRGGMYKIWIAVVFVLFSMGTSFAQMSVQEWQETASTTSCGADIESDGDVDGADLYDFAAYFDSDGLAEFASAYGSSALLINEPFLDLDLKARGWSRPTSCITMVYDQHLGRDVGQSEFVAGNSRAVSGAMGAYFYLPEALDEFTVIFKEKVIGSAVLGNQIIHGMYALPESDDGTLPQRSRGTLYFDPSKSQDLEPGSWVLAFQDTVSMSCPQGNVNLYGVSEDRSVGGCQQDYQQQERVRRFCSSDFCQDPEHAQSGWTLFPTANVVEYPIEHNEWATFVYYVRLNTPGKFDGVATLHVKREDDSTYTQTIKANNLMFRAAGWNKNLKIGKFLFGPFASANKYNFKVRWADLKVYSGDARKTCWQQ